MKQRVISAMVGLALLFLVLLFYDTVILNIAISAICVIGVYEIVVRTKYVKDKMLAGVAMAFAACVPFFGVKSFERVNDGILIAYVFLLFVILLSKYKQVKVENLAITFAMSVFIPYS
ncbi:MAG: phosphatidate cytidylyltransferase, partial [Oscillospiraceae bacterium]|nr:phosphatidate cytidylyltransferase [Oscillospiraceae bacterium]